MEIALPKYLNSNSNPNFVHCLKLTMPGPTRKQIRKQGLEITHGWGTLWTALSVHWGV